MIVPKSKGSLYRKMIRNSLRRITGLQVDAGIMNGNRKRSHPTSELRIPINDYRHRLEFFRASDGPAALRCCIRRSHRAID